MPFTPLLRAIAIVVLLGLLGGCDTLFGAGDPITSAAPTVLSDAAAKTIAADMVRSFVPHVGPGRNTIILKLDGSTFGLALEQALTASGYAVVTDQPINTKNGITLAYVVDDFGGGVLARLSTPTVNLGRAYHITSSGATPSSPLSVMERGAPA